MKLHVHLTIKRIYAYSAVALILMAAGVISITSCSRKVMSKEEAARWIAAYTPAHIDQDSKIRIELTDLMKSKIDTTRSLEKAFRFSPNIKGRAVYSPDKRFIDFIPVESMKQGRQYECHVNLRAITAVDSLADFAFDFYVDKRKVRFEDVSVIVDPDNISYMTIKGRLEYNVAVGDSVINDSTFIVCDYPGAEIKLDKKAENHSRGFKITRIKRQSKDKKLRLSTNPIGGFSTKDYEVIVPSVSDFTLLNAERIEASVPYLNLEFSTPLSSTQELEGLITLDNIPDIRIERSGTNVKIFYPTNGIKDITLRIADLLKNIDGRSLDEEIERHFMQEVIPPAIEIPFGGNILPDNRNLKLPFRAVNLAAVDVEVVKVFPANIMSFLQADDLDDTDVPLRRFGRLIYHQTVRLDRDKSLNLHQWQNFSIDLKNLFVRERGAIYNISLTFRKAYSLYNRSKPEDFEEISGVTERDNNTWDLDWSYIERYAPDHNWYKYNWDETDDPSKDSYYMVREDRMPEVNLVASNLGLIVKRGDDNFIKAVVNNIVTAQPVAGIHVTAYNYQLQKIGYGVTDEKGFADFKTEGSPFMITASDGLSTTYLKVTSSRELSTSSFDVSGKTITDGIKGFTYGERGVWRPGDDIHLTLIVEDKGKKLPANHPVIMELYNPSEQLYDRQILEKAIDGFYVFHISTEETVPTGLWTAQFKVGNETFYHPVRIETIKPNRLKIDINTPSIIQANTNTPIGLNCRWLTGPVAKKMSVSLDMTLYTNANPFDNYKSFIFKNPLISYTSSQKVLYTGVTDSLGRITRNCIVGADCNSPGMLQANITAKVTEPGGDASIVSKSVPFSPFGVYVGIDLLGKDFETDKEIKFPVVVLNQAGAKIKKRELEYKIYRLDWYWWWEGNPYDLSRYVKSSTANVIAAGRITVCNGVAELPFKVDYPNYGKYLILVRDIKGGHATGGVFSVDWPEWRGRSNKNSASGSTELSFTLDKSQYEVGEMANVYLPKCKGGRVLLSFENGTQVLKRQWVSLDTDKETKYPVLIDKSMAPNFYVTATMLRPHKETDFDTHIRLFGIQSMRVINPQSILHPVIDMPDELHPQQQFTVKIREKDNKPMTYTIAIVDEGLLDVTNFKTPCPWYAMNQKEALGIRTWDMYDDVIGAFGSNFRSILSVGGDETLRKSAGKEKRFNPAVKFVGPFTIKGGTKAHKITLPNYVGSVRVMVVAAHDGSYGNADKTVKVTSPIMLLSTLPRTLANCDTVNVPVNVFAMENGIKDVAVNIDVDGPIKVLGKKVRNIVFKEMGEQLTEFRLVCDNSKEGKARIILTATANGHIAKDTTFIDVSNPMPIIYNTTEKTLAANGSTYFSWSSNDVGNVMLQVSSMPMLNFSGVSQFLESYPHLCTEQLSSKALFMLFGRKFLDAEEKGKCDKDLPRLIKFVQSRQLTNGGFVYWPRQQTENDWVTSMAGLVLSEASRQGFRIDKSCLEKWRNYQEVHARDYKYSLNSDLTQAFRLYSLAIAGSVQTAAMNRLRESKRLSQTAAYCLASAYAESGRKDVAIKLIERANRTEPTKSGDMFSSEMRDKAIALEAYTLCDMTSEALTIAHKIASTCSATSYVTQDVAFATIALNHLSNLMGNGLNSIRIAQPGKTPMTIAGFNGLKVFSLDRQGGRVNVENLNNKGSLELSLLSSHRLASNKKVSAYAKGMKMTIKYTSFKGAPVSITNIKQDSEFYAVITVTNLSDDVDNMALTYTIPSGWEIWNGRLYGSSDSSFDNCDIRDNSSKFYFRLKKGTSKTIKIRLRAVYPGCYMLPPVVCEDMYNPGCRAMTSNRRVSVLQ